LFVEQPMLKVIGFSVVPIVALLGSAAYTLGVSYRLRDWRPVLFVGVLLVMAIHQGNELFVIADQGVEVPLSGFGEYPETTANLLASVATVLMLRFVTRERELTEELRDLTGDLEDRVQERTAELESFAYSVSHDLRTPLRAIDGYTQLLATNHADQLDDEGRRLLSVVRDSTQKMGMLIDDLLTLSRLGRREIETCPLDMERLTRDAYEEVCRAHSAAENGTLEVHPLPDVVGDPVMMRHVMSNLLGNAVKFSREEEDPHVEVGGEENGNASVFFVRDNGVGFDVEYAHKLFGVFERLHEEDEFEGTGVGLAIVERVVQRHGGEVCAESEKGEGATIYFSLPNDHDNE
jgi:light-regulated signal transduction histidine kinase (bacteriophytochrome)